MILYCVIVFLILVSVTVPAAYFVGKRAGGKNRRKVYQESSYITDGGIWYNTLFELASYAIVIVKEGRIYDFNLKFSELFMCKHRHLEGISIESLFSVYNDSESGLFSLADIFSGNSGMHTRAVFELRGLQFDGGEFDCEISLNVIEIARERFTVIMVRDISIQKTVNRLLSEARSILNYRTLEQTRRISALSSELDFAVEGRSSAEKALTEAMKLLADREEEKRTILENLYDVFIKFDSDYVIQYLTPSIERVAGYSRDQLAGGSVFKLFPERAEVESFVDVLRKYGFAEKSIVKLRHGDSFIIYVSLNGRIVYDADGNFSVEAIMRDETAVVANDLALRESEDQLKSILDSSMFPLVILARKTRKIVYLNASSVKLFGLREDVAPGSINVDDYVQDANETALIIDQIRSKGKVDNQEIKLKKQDGTSFWALISVIYMEYRQDDCLLISLNDISRKKMIEKELEQLARTDPLTGILNRRAYLQMSEVEVERAKRYGGSVSVMMIDIDRFKGINDNYGHHTGDMVIKELAVGIGSLLRSNDFFGRLGGEEFAVTMINISSSELEPAAERIRSAVEHLTFKNDRGEAFSVTVSIGAAEVNLNEEAGSSVESALDCADRALYEAKGSGRNRVVVYSKCS